MAAPRKLLSLVEKFERNVDAYKTGHYNEAQVRKEFIDPLFKLLGWDMDNEDGLAEAYKDVIHEDAIKIGGFVKAPDYCFRIGGTRKFFLEAKKPSISIKDDTDPAFQLRRYAWSAKLPLSILTDFEEFAVYDCCVKPVKTDKASIARTNLINYTEYAGRWDEIASVFSKDAVLKGSFDKYAESHKAKRGTASVDEAFLKEVESWRDMLARNIALRNLRLTQRELNVSVQSTIDRIIFLRICEDRKIEDYGRLMALQNGTQVYRRLCKLFRDADARYNSGIFHFNREKDRPTPPDELTLGLKIDDRVLKEIFKGLYYPESPYEFSVLSADILGQVYEQFLGKVIRLTSGHRAAIDYKPEVKKAGGVYYTPTYIVDYIVKNTVGKLLEGKKPGPRGGVSKLRILDPACGSGSFLIGAYQYLLDWHRDKYADDDNPKKHRKVLYQAAGGEWRLTTAERKRILLNNIYGVDIDPQAVEVTKLSLLLKVLEGESGETLTRQLKFFHERALPDLGNNIKCGNSLIGPDFYDNEQLNLFDEEERYRINAFDWHTEFPDIMKSGGFDAVIGNPPYVRQEMLGTFKGYLQKKYTVYQGTADLYAYFIERGVSLLKPGGFFSYIVANKWMRANYGGPLRFWMKQQRIEEIIDFGDLPVFQKATTYPCIIRIANASPRSFFDVTQIETLEFESLKQYVREKHYTVKRSTLDDKGWSLTDRHTQQLLSKLKAVGVSLAEYVNRKIYRGVLTGLNEAFVIDRETRNSLIAKDSKSRELIKPFLVGREIKRYNPLNNDHYLILIPKGWTNSHRKGSGNAWDCLQSTYSAIASHLLPFKEVAQRRCDKGDYWWELRACDYYDEFEKPKIIVPDISIRGNFALDEIGKCYCVNTAYIICTADKYLFGILNSSLITFFYKSISSMYRGNYLRFIYQYLVQLPIHTIDFSNAKDKARHDRIVGLAERMLDLNKKLQKTKTEHDKTVLKRQIGATDRQIDNLVYELYGLTKKEIAIVEESAK
ncbi:MAG: TaqI-like C-terminal specificity domain-containing protein [Candidatus Brocadiales bacterium]